MKKSYYIIIFIFISMVGVNIDFKTWITPFFISIVGYCILVTLEEKKS